MRVFGGLILACVILSDAGCGQKRSFDGPTVEAFTGQLTFDGKPITLPADAQVSLKLNHQSGQSFGIPITPQGTFKIGWMPIGKYGATMEHHNPGGKGKSVYTVPGGLTIEDGKTEYSIELGKNWPGGKKKEPG